MSSEQPDRPFFIIGAPRSGTTYLAKVLNRHRRILCTDETRVMTWVNRALNDLPADQRTIMTNRERWLALLEAELPRLVERFYAGLGAGPGVRWGDKNPHYADPRTDPAALATIDRLFPASQFIHIVRDGRNVVVSLMAKGWAKNIAYGIDVWRRHVVASRDFGRGLAPGRFLELRYEDLVADEVGMVNDILSFLDVPADAALTRYLREGRSAEDPVSKPLTPPTEFGLPQWTGRLTGQQLAEVERELGELLVEYGYESEAWLAEVCQRPQPEPQRQAANPLHVRVRELLAADDPDPEALRAALRDLNRRRKALEADLAQRDRELLQLSQALARARPAESSLARLARRSLDGMPERLARAARRLTRGRGRGR